MNISSLTDSNVKMLKGLSLMKEIFPIQVMDLEIYVIHCVISLM